MALEQESEKNVERKKAPVPVAQGSKDIGEECEIAVRKAVGGFLKASGVFMSGALKLVQEAAQGTAVVAEKSANVTVAVAKGVAEGVYDAGAEAVVTVGRAASWTAKGVYDVGGEVIATTVKAIAGTARSVSETGSAVAGAAGRAACEGIDAGKDIALKVATEGKKAIEAAAKTGREIVVATATTTGKAFGEVVKAGESLGAGGFGILRGIVVGVAEGVKDALSAAPPEEAAEQP